MKALILEVNRTSWGNTKGYKVAEIDAPVLNESVNPEDANFVLVEPMLAGMCGTDKGLWHRKAFKDSVINYLEKDDKDYRVAGHEFLGKVVAVGSKVLDIQVGQTVSTESHLYCGHCTACESGNQHVCLNERIIGVTSDGIFAQTVKLPAKVLWPTNLDKIRPEIAAIMEPFGNAVHACSPFPMPDREQYTHLKNKNVAIFGCGTIGLFSILIAKAMGAKRILGIEPNPINQEKARACGADEVIAPTDNTGVEVVNYFGGLGADYCLEMSGFHSSVLQAIKSATSGGAIVLFGLQNGDLTIPNFQDLIISGKRIYSVVGRRIFDSWQITQALLEDKSNGIQDKIWDVILEQGKDTIVDIDHFDPETFEAKLDKHSKVLLRFYH